MTKHFCPKCGKPAKFMDYVMSGEVIIECSKEKKQWIIDELFGDDKIKENN